TEGGLKPSPRTRSIPVLLGGRGEVLVPRVGRPRHGLFPQGKPDDHMRRLLERLISYIKEVGRDPSTVGIEARVNASEGNLDEWVLQTEGWRALGATHISLNTMGAGFNSPGEHIDAIRRYTEAIAS